ncbi:MAG: haloacid dehalogenase [Rhodospirillales bacterium]|jgi:phosphoglycolate phosphatase|nr:haloacid dehalogenase [Rhodospirillales bacterium]
MVEPCLIVFDCDGTLVDAQAGIIQAMLEAFAAAGLPPPGSEAIRRGVGLSLEAAVERLLPEPDPDLVLRLADLYRDAFVALRQRPEFTEPLYPGTLDMLDRLGRAGIVLGVATGKGRRGLRHSLERHGLQDLFTVLQTADDAAGKPAPDMLLNAMAETGIERNRTLMVGDTTFDMLMAQAARVASVGVSWGYHAPGELAAAGAARVLDRFADLVPHAAELFTIEA